MKIKVVADIPSLKKDANGYVDMEQIIYHVIRCGLVHNCNIEKAIVFTERTIIGDLNKGVFYLPKHLIWGLIAAINEFMQSNITK